jgi:hypothetical protein
LAFFLRSISNMFSSFFSFFRSLATCFSMTHSPIHRPSLIFTFTANNLIQSTRKKPFWILSSLCQRFRILATKSNYVARNKYITFFPICGRKEPMTITKNIGRNTPRANTLLYQRENKLNYAGEYRFCQVAPRIVRSLLLFSFVRAPYARDSQKSSLTLLPRY